MDFQNENGGKQTQVLQKEDFEVKSKEQNMKIISAYSFSAVRSKNQEKRIMGSFCFAPDILLPFIKDLIHPMLQKNQCMF